jgi:uncharacterized protein
MYFIDRRLNPKGKSLTNRQRFLRRARDEIRHGVKEAVKNGKVADVGANGRVSIPSKGLHEPRFRYDHGEGVSDRVYPGNKEFVEGDKIPRPPSGAGKGGKDSEASEDGEGQDDFRFTLTREEFLDIFFEDLELPDLVKTELKEVVEFEYRRAGIVKTGAPANMDLRRTMRHSLTRRIGLKRPRLREVEALEQEAETLRSKSTQSPLNDADQKRLDEIEVKIETLKTRRRVIPYIDPGDVRFKSFTKVPLPNTRAVMFCLMDVSGSMTEEKKDLAKRFFMLLHLFLTRRYERVEVVFIRHTSQASEVDEETFFYSTETGGTIVSTALEEMRTIAAERYPTSSWNIYAAQASDGDTFGKDEETCVDLLRREIMPACQYFAYVEVMEAFEEELFKDESNATKLWRAYSAVREDHDNFAMRRVSRPPDIFPIFRDLFTTDAEG